MSKRAAELMAVLLDASKEFDDRYNAARELGDYDDAITEATLIKAASNHAEDVDLLDAIGESLYLIWSRKNFRDEKIIKQLHPVAQKFFEI